MAFISDTCNEETEANFDDNVNVWNMIQEIGPGENASANCAPNNIKLVSSGKNMKIQVSENIILRSFEDEDIPSITKSANNKKIFNNLRDLFPHPYTEQDAENFVSFAKDKEFGLFMGIVYENKCIGSIGLQKGRIFTD